MIWDIRNDFLACTLMAHSPAPAAAAYRRRPSLSLPPAGPKRAKTTKSEKKISLLGKNKKKAKKKKRKKRGKKEKGNGCMFYAIRKSNPGHSHGKRVCYHYTNGVQSVQ